MDNNTSQGHYASDPVSPAVSTRGVPNNAGGGNNNHNNNNHGEAAPVLTPISESTSSPNCFIPAPSNSYQQEQQPPSTMSMAHATTAIPTMQTTPPQPPAYARQPFVAAFHTQPPWLQQQQRPRQQQKAPSPLPSRGSGMQYQQPLPSFASSYPMPSTTPPPACNCHTPTPPPSYTPSSSPTRLPSRSRNPPRIPSPKLSRANTSNLTARRFARFPALAEKLRSLSLPLMPLVQLTTGQVHPAFPRDMLGYHLLTDEDLESLAHFYHQRTPSRWSAAYPAPIVGGWRPDLPLEVKRRKMGRFIGLRGCESPTMATMTSSGDAQAAAAAAAALYDGGIIGNSNNNDNDSTRATTGGDQHDWHMDVPSEEDILDQARRKTVRESEDEEAWKRKFGWY